MKSICCRLLIDLAAVVAIAVALVIPMPAMAALITLRIPGIPGDLKVKGEEGAIEALSLD